MNKELTLQELSDLLGVCVALDEDHAVNLFDSEPKIDGNHWTNSREYGGTDIGNCIFLTDDKNIEIDSNIDWKKSLCYPCNVNDVTSRLMHNRGEN